VLSEMLWIKYILGLLAFNSVAHICQRLVGYREVRRVRGRGHSYFDLVSLSAPQVTEDKTRRIPQHNERRRVINNAVVERIFFFFFFVLPSGAYHVLR
jgi:hypothetical protein